MDKELKENTNIIYSDIVEVGISLCNPNTPYMPSYVTNKYCK